MPTREVIPLAYIDPSAMAEVSAAACAQDKHCVTVNVNVIWDKGLSDSQKTAFEKNQLQNAKDQYGDADIDLKVTYTEGSVTRNGDNISVSKSAIKAGARNVAVTDEVLTDQGKSGRNGTTAVSFVAPNGTDLPHEMAHQFTGDTNPGIVNGFLSKDPTGFLLGLSDTYADFSNDFERAWMRNLDQHSGVMSHYLFASVFNHDAVVFQKSIQPTTKPQ